MKTDHFNEGLPGGIAAWLAGAASDWNDGIQVDACPDLERIFVQTRYSAYELIVLRGNVGEILIRGGHYFPEFRRARLVGATAGGSSVKLRGVYVGLRIELRVGHKSIITSTVQGISRRSPASWGRDANN